MKPTALNFLMIVATFCFSYLAHANEMNVFVAVSQRCIYCSPLAKTSVVAMQNLSDWSKYGFVLTYSLVAQNTENVYRWQSEEALTTLWSMNEGLYYCSGDFQLREGDFFVRRLDSCRKATPKEQDDYKNAFRSTTPGGH